MMKYFEAFGTLALSIAARRAATTCLVALSVLIASCDQSPDAVAQEYLKSAQQSFEKGNIDAARIQLKNLLKEDPQNAQGRLLLGRVYLAAKDGAAAEKELLKAKELGITGDEVDLLIAQARIQQRQYQPVVNAVSQQTKPDSQITRDLLVARGEALVGLGDLEQARQTFETVLKEKPHAGAEAGLARIALQKREFDKAREHIDAGLKLSPQNQELALLDAEWHYDQSRYQQALDLYKKASQLDPEDPYALIGLVRSAAAVGRVEEANQELNRLKALAPNSALVALVESVLRLQEKDYKEAQKSAEQVLAVNAQDATALYVSGMSSYELNELESARSRLEQYLNIVPSNEQARVVLTATAFKLHQLDAAYKIAGAPSATAAGDPAYASILSKAALMTGDEASAVQNLEALAEKNPTDAALQERLGDAKVAAGDFAGAESAFQKALQIEPGRTTAQVKLYALYQRQKDFGKALQVAETLQKQKPDSALGFNLAGFIHLSLREFGKAEEAFLAAVKREPDSAEANGNLAQVYEIERKFDKAREVFDSILTKHPELEKMQLAYATMEERQGNLNKAAKLLQTAIASSPDSLQPPIQLGNLYLNAGRPVEALKVTEAALVQHPDSQGLLEVVGVGRLRAGDSQGALTALQKLVKLNPAKPNGYFYLAQAYEAGGQYAEALNSADAALKIDPNFVPAKFARIRYLALVGRLADAKVQLAALKEDFKGNQAVLPNLIAIEGRILLEEGQKDEAIARFKQAFELRQDDVTLQELARAELQTGQKDSAVARMETWLAQNPDDLVVRNSLAEVLLVSGDLRASMAQYQEMLKRTPNNPRLLNNMAWIYTTLGQPKDAIPLASKSLELVPGDADFSDTLAVALLESGEPAKALELLNKAAEAKPDSATILFHRARALADTGSTAEARRELDSLLSKQKPFPERAQAEKLLKSLAP